MVWALTQKPDSLTSTMITGCFFLRLSSFLWLTPTFAPIFCGTYLKYMSDRSSTISWWIYSSSIPRKHLGKVLVVVGCVGTEDITNTCWGRGYSQEGPTKPAPKFSSSLSLQWHHLLQHPKQTHIGATQCNHRESPGILGRNEHMARVGALFPEGTWTSPYSIATDH